MNDGVEAMATLFERFRRDESGATAIEYVFIAGLLSIAIIVGATAIGAKLNTGFTDLSKNFKGK